MTEVPEAAMPNFSQEELLFIINHIFLPPKLPQKDDTKPHLENSLLRLVSTSLVKFAGVLPSEQVPAVENVAAAITRLIAVRDANGAVDVESLVRSLETLIIAKPGTTIPLHLVAQNAGVLISKQSDRFNFEVFELSATNHATMSTTGRLRRHFPGPALTIDTSYFENGEFLADLAQTLSTLSFQKAPEMTPIVRKAGQNVQEIRDTTIPRLVTELLTNVLMVISRTLAVERICKHVRDEVLWDDALLPWRRSPLWLLVRVTMQLLFTRAKPVADFVGAKEVCFYKLFVLSLHATVLDEALRQGNTINLDLLYCISAKITRRMLKLDVPDDYPGIRSVKAVLERSQTHTAQRWLAAQDCNARVLDLARLSSLDFHEDLTLLLPELDAHLERMSTKNCGVDQAHFTPASELLHFPAINLPVGLRGTSDDRPYNLSAFEDWVSAHLRACVYNHRRDSSTTCRDLKRLMREYHNEALSIDHDNPERRSMMFLILLELWMALDEAAIAELPMLADYDPDIPFKHIQYLLMPKQEHMVRLQRIEKYLQERRVQAGHAGSIFQDFGTATCLSVRFFDQSDKHQILRQRIEVDASRERDRKRQELASKKARYQQLITRYKALSCEFWEKIDRRGRKYTKHSYTCEKCSCKSEANNIRIQVHEWPLPTNELDLKSVVFELDPPEAFCSWRDATMYMIQNVLGSMYCVLKQPRATNPLRGYSALAPYFSSSADRIGLLSQDKPHVITHRNTHFSMSTVTENDVCLNNGLHFLYFDTHLKCFVTKISPTDDVLKACTYQLPSESNAALQKFLMRRFQGTDSTPNEVISGLSECPAHLSLAEFRSLATIPVGYRVQWINILTQLSCQTIDLKKMEATLIILQTIYQAGPVEHDDIRRGGHYILTDLEFAHKLLDAVDGSARRIEKNWESMSTLSLLVSILERLLSLTPSPDIEILALNLLSYLRNIALRWVQILKQKLELSQDDSQMAQFLTRVVEGALVYCQTFDIDDKHLDSVITSPENASFLIQCDILIHDRYQSMSSKVAVNALPRLLYRRWKQISHRAWPILQREILRKGTLTCLDGAVKASWPDYQAGGSWTTAGPGVDHWVVSDTSSLSGRSLRVHYNLLTGKLLINGLPLARLPSEYENHHAYNELFGREVFEIVPSTHPGTRFSSKRLYKGHSLRFGMDGNHLIVQAYKDDQVWELLPRNLFQARLPQYFTDEFFHWFNLDDRVIEFRTRHQPWSIDRSTWRLKLISGHWLLEKRGSTLVSPASPTGHALAAIFSSVQPPLRINLVLAADKQTLEIDLPMLQSNFVLQQGKTSIVSRKQRGFQVDSCQSFGTLIGLGTMLVLRNPLNNEQRVLIPKGEVQVSQAGDHVQVSIEPEAGSPYEYGVDSLLQKLGDNGSLQSKLFLCYLHALTSACLPDPLTFRTGTEQSLSILKSAAVRSFPILSLKDVKLLEDIEALTPGRVFYPQDLRVMQTVKWNENLSMLSQHSLFRVSVMDLFDQYKMTQLYFPAEYTQPPRFKEVHPDLLARDLSRSSTYRITCFGAEEAKASPDVTYQSRDTELSSERGRQAQIVAEMLFRRRVYQLRQPSFSHAKLQEHIWAVLKSAGTSVAGPLKPEFLPQDFAYDAKWLEAEDHPAYWAQIWCWMHEHGQGILMCSSARLHFLMWLATMAYASQADLDMIYVAVSMLVVPAMHAIRPLSGGQLLSTTLQYNLSAGAVILHHELRSLIEKTLLPMEDCPEQFLPYEVDETQEEHYERQRTQYEKAQEKAITQLLNHVASQFPSPKLCPPTDSMQAFQRKYIRLGEAMFAIRPHFDMKYNNHLFELYLLGIQQAIHRQAIRQLDAQSIQFTLPEYSPASTQAPPFIRTMDLFSEAPLGPVPAQPRLAAQEFLSRSPPGAEQGDLSKSLLDSLVNKKDLQAKSLLERQYAAELRHSQSKFKLTSNGQQKMLEGRTEVQATLERHYAEAGQHAKALLNSMIAAARNNLGTKAFAESLTVSPRLSSVFFIHQLSQNGWEDGGGWSHLPSVWKPWIVAYGIALTQLQRATRLLWSLNKETDLIRELRNEGHTNWDPSRYPESLLIEIEGNILIRDVQEDIAEKMRNPPHLRNTVMQLNMGEGKSSVIVPIVSVALADTLRLVRVIVAKPQSRQMLRTLVSKLGGLLNRRIFFLPFSRDIRLSESDAQNILSACRLCMATRGIMLLQPEHILSFKLMGRESFISDHEPIGRCLVQTQRFFDNNSRDIVDESDENFSVKFELIFTMGTQSSIDFAPYRWIIIQTILGIIKEHVDAVQKELPLSIEVSKRARGAFPRVRVFRKDAMDMLSNLVAQDVCSKGFPGFPISRQSPASSNAVLRYITHPELSLAEIAAVEDGDFWTDSTKDHILLLRGLFAKGIFPFVFGHKRWRVNYGPDATRRPPTKLAVPYRAKDSPSPRSEFSHPDVVIILTCLSYYYQGLDDEDLALAFSHLVESDQASDEYHAWVVDSHGLAQGFCQLLGINLKDTVQCRTEVFPAFRYAKRTIDYFLQHVVFGKAMKEFPEKLSASGWDLGAVKAQPTTGFSGTIDSKRVLPLDVHYLGLAEQECTNAQVMNYLLQPENKVVLLPPPLSSSPAGGPGTVARGEPSSDAETILKVVLGQKDPCLRVILDVGAQVLELTNAEMAASWLKQAHKQDSSVQAAIYFNDSEEIMVLDIHGMVEPFWTSPYLEQLDVCLVFLDEAHTRGTDLKLPQYYRAAVTLGANLTKDRLVQACMRMRKLGQGQSVVFLIPQEIQTKIRQEVQQEENLQGDSLSGQISVEVVLSWAINETIRDIVRSVPLWAMQGRRFAHHQAHWEAVSRTDGLEMTAEIARKFLEKEAQTVEQRYRPESKTPPEPPSSCEGSDRLKAIRQRCLEYGSTNANQSTLEEEQERELSPEIEEESQIERPPPAVAAPHSLHLDLSAFVRSGTLQARSPAFLSAFKALQDTSAANNLDISQFPSGILVTADFARTVVKSTTGRFISEIYHRPVHLILSSQPKDWKHVVVISPYEAQELMPRIQASKNVTLHVYAARLSQDVQPIDRLDLYTVSASRPKPPSPLPLRLRTQLNLFAGQLYLAHIDEYAELCKILRLSRQQATEETVTDADGFIRSSTSSATCAIIDASTFTKSPVKFLRSFLTKVRRDNQSIEKTHLGRILNGALLRSSDFDGQLEDGHVGLSSE